MSAESFLPALGRVSRAVKAEAQLPHQVSTVMRIFFWQFDEDVPVDLCVEVRPAYVADDHLPPFSPRDLRGCETGDHSKCLQWRGGRIQGVILPDVELATYQAGTVVPVGGVALVHVHPPDSDQFASCPHHL